MSYLFCLLVKLCYNTFTKGSGSMELINQTLIMAFLGIIAACSVTFPILFLVQRRKQHKQLMEVLSHQEEKTSEN